MSVEFVEADQDWHTHDTEEVVAVVAGSATFFLDESARIIRARQVVGIPAAASHRVVAHESFSAVAARAE